MNTRTAYSISGMIALSLAAFCFIKREQTVSVKIPSPTSQVSSVEVGETCYGDDEIGLVCD